MVGNRSGNCEESAISDAEVGTVMMIFKTALPRRTFLRGMGTAMALPLLDGMVPALATAQGRPKSPTRLSFVYVPNGIIMNHWTPVTTGAGFEMTPILAPLAAHRRNL